MTDKVWFITGASKGLGREFTEAALERGDRVAACARDIAALEPLSQRFGDRLLRLTLDVDDRAADFDAVNRAHDTFGRLDVVVNNAGYGHFGAFEELTETDLRDQLETNLFGAIWVTQAALPHLRQQGNGHVVQVTSMAGVLAPPYLSAYNASKWALEAMSESLAAEVAANGIKVTIVEPGPFGTDWAGPSARTSEPLPQYDGLRQMTAKMQAAVTSGEPSAAAQALLAVVDAECPPLRVLFGSQALTFVTGVYEHRLKEWHDWANLSELAQG